VEFVGTLTGANAGSGARACKLERAPRIQKGGRVEEPAYEIRRVVRVIGPGSPGHIKVKDVGAPSPYTVEVPAGRIPEHLRGANAEFVAVMRAREFLRVEAAGRAWLAIQDGIREILNSDWDPIGVAEGATPDDPTFDEYESYISGIYGLLKRRATEDEVAEHLQRIEAEQMGLAGSEATRRVAARRLLALHLPAVT
jgi:hypothetical protein